MKERRAVGQVLSHLKERADESDATEADVQARTTIAEIEKKAFKKSPDSPLRVAIKRKMAKRRERSNPSGGYVGCIYAIFHEDGAYDTPYKADLHKRAILWELRHRTGVPFLGPHEKKSKRTGKYGLSAAVKLRNAILRDAPLLKGFFAEEPSWREKILLWCENTLKAGSDS